MVQDLGDRADLGALGGDHGEPDQFLVVVVVGVVGRGDVGGVDDEPRAAELLRGGAVVDPGEAHEQAPRMPASTLDGERAGGRRVGGERGSRREPGLGIVRADVDRVLTADPVR